MDTRHLVDPELLPTLEAMGGYLLNEQTLAPMRAQSRARLPADDGAGDGLDVRVEHRSVPARDGRTVPVMIVAPGKAGRGRGGILHIHGGGMVVGSPQIALAGLRRQVAALDCVAVSVDYRLAPEHPFPAAIDDCHDALRWMASAADALGVDPARIGVSGESAGGGLAAALALVARDRGGPALAFQNLLYPMLDDRPEADAGNPVTGEFVWTRETNRFGWSCLLGADPGQVSPYAAPARATDLAGLPPAWIAVGALDLLLDEDVDYAMRLTRAGVAAELVVYPGAFHGFDFAADAAVTHRAHAQRLDALARGLAPRTR